MSENLCQCGKPATVTICNECKGRLRKALRALPDALADLDVTIARQVSTAQSAGGKPTKASESPLPINIEAATLVHDLGLSSVLFGWIRAIDPRAEERIRKSSATDAWRAIWLSHHVDAIAQDTEAAALLKYLHTVLGKLRAAVDTYPEGAYYGKCPKVVESVTVDMAAEVITATAETHVCGAILRARTGQEVVTCRCGAVYTVADLQARLLSRSLGLVLKGDELADVLTRAGTRITWSSVRKMAARRQITEVTLDRDGCKLYRISDVLAVLEARRLAKLELTGATDA